MSSDLQALALSKGCVDFHLCFTLSLPFEFKHYVIWTLSGTAPLHSSTAVGVKRRKIVKVTGVLQHHIEANKYLDSLIMTAQPCFLLRYVPLLFDLHCSRNALPECVPESH